MKVYRNYLTTAQQEYLLRFYSKLSFRPCPQWLGNFKFTYDSWPAIADPGLMATIEHLCELVPDQSFNTVFLQKYDVGSYVSEHRDPRNNMEFTIIAVFGEFTGAETTYMESVREGPKKLQLLKGDVLVQPCTFAGVQGPPHSVSPVTSGTRYALILNTVIK